MNNNRLSHRCKFLCFFWTDLSSVLSQSTRWTDRRTNRRTEFSSLDRVCIPCSAVKTIVYLIVVNSCAFTGYGTLLLGFPCCSVRSHIIVSELETYADIMLSLTSNFVFAFFLWKQARSNWNFNTVCRMVSIRGRSLFSLRPLIKLQPL